MWLIDTSGLIGVGHEDQLAQHAVGSLGIGCVERDEIVARFSNVKIKGSLPDAGVAFGGTAFQVCGRGDGSACHLLPRAFLYAQFYGLGFSHIPVAQLVFEGVVPCLQREG